MPNYASTAISARLKALKSRHLTTSINIRLEQSRSNPDPFRLQEMKRKRLKLKDEIAGYSFI